MYLQLYAFIDKCINSICLVLLKTEIDVIRFDSIAHIQLKHHEDDGLTGRMSRIVIQNNKWVLSGTCEY